MKQEVNIVRKWMWAPVSRSWLCVDPTGRYEPIEVKDLGGSAEAGPSKQALLQMAELMKGEQAVLVA